MSELDRSQPIAVVTQVINDLEAQGLLMLFDQHDHIAKRLTGDLMAAGVLQVCPIERSFPAYPQPSDEAFDS